MAAHQSGQHAQAEGLYRQVLDRAPNHPDAQHFLGMLRCQSGNHEEGLRLIRRSIAAAPEVGSFHNNLGSVLKDRGELKAAAAAFRKALAIEPSDADGLFNLSVVLHQLGQRAEAEKNLRRVIQSNAGDAEAHHALGNVLKDDGRTEEAVAAYRTALDLRPDAGAMYSNLGVALQILGRLDEAVRTYEQGLRARPNDPALNTNLGNALRAAGQYVQAVDCYRRALAANPELPEAALNLGQTLKELGEIEEAAVSFRQAIRSRPDFPEARLGLASALRSLRPTTYRPEMEQEIQTCFADPNIDPQDLARIAAAQIRLKHDAESRGKDKVLVDDLASDRLLPMLLERCTNIDPLLEPILTLLRQEILARTVGKGKSAAGKVPLRLACAMALQCFTNEYLWDCSEPETVLIGELEARVDNALGSSTSLPEQQLLELAVLAMYQSPANLPRAAVLADSAYGIKGPAGEVLRRCVAEPLAERAYATEVKSLCDITDGTSQDVRAQYETNPYPRWRHMAKPRPQSVAESLKQRFPDFEPAAVLAADGVEILVAGCGTGQEPIALGRTHPTSRVLGMDLSRASLAYGIRAAKQFAAKNVRFLHGDILSLGELEQQFHVVTATGVIHHMARPEEGLAALVDRVHPGGVLKLGLYSEQARQAVIAARAEIEKAGLLPKPENIRKLRGRILSCKKTDELHELAASEDLYTVSGTRDLLFHVCEHRYTLAAVRDLLSRFGLHFLGFELINPLARQRYSELAPTDKGLADLPTWEKVETHYPDTFAAMYQFWCQKPAA